jgi:hypothetical protein
MLVFHPADAGGGDVDALCRALCAQAGLVVLWTVQPVALGDAATALEWAADHATELDADPGRLLVGGQGAGAALAAAAALRARDEGWPALARQVLVLPRFAHDDGAAGAAGLAGVAPATIVTDGGAASEYAGRLRRAGVAVDELRHGADRSSAQLATDIAAALRRRCTGDDA